MTTYAAAVEHLYALGHELAPGKPRRFDLAHMRALVEALGHPELAYRSILIAGTNGKGSTSATLAAILQAAGYRTGLYTSPHLIRINERIRVDGAPIADADLAAMYDRVAAAAAQLVERGALPQLPSFFETVTAMAFAHFAGAGVEYAVLEVGMGGRLDATNVVEPALSIITDIALDHQQYLGDTVTAIAREKAGIIREGGVVVTLPQHPEANEVIGQTILERRARGVNATPYVPNVSPGAVKFEHLRPNAVQMGHFLRNRYFLEVMDEAVLLESPLIGRHQVRNLALAIAAAVELNQQGARIRTEHISAGVRDTQWPGRFQFLFGGADHRDFLLDVAHNPAGAWSLRSALSENFEDRPVTFVFGAMRDKAVREMAEILFPVGVHVVATQAKGHPRAATPDEIAGLAPAGTEIVTAADVPAALVRAQALTPRDGLVVVTGSIYIVGEALELLRPED
jgi:dihydrofolate synthase/folylpolyglutamate synthase